MALKRNLKPAMKPKSFFKATVVKVKNKAWAYTPFARDFLRKHPNFIRTFKEALSEMAKNKGHPVEVNGLKLEAIPFYGYLKASYGRTKLFIRTGRGVEGTTAIEKLQIMEKAAPILRKHGIEPMRYHFAFSSEIGGKRTDFIVAKFFNLRLVTNQPEPFFSKHLLPKIKAADKELMKNKINDLRPGNILYDPKRNMMIAFDLF